MHSRIVLVSGKARAGKDTIALALKGEMQAEGGPPAYVGLPFAAELKATYCRLFGVTLEELNTTEGRAKHRPGLIRFGRVMRELDPNVWVDYVARQIKEHDAWCISEGERPLPTYVVPDARFWNEVHRMLFHFGPRVLLTTVSASAQARAERMGAVGAREYVASGAHLDPSETQLDGLTGQLVAPAKEVADDIQAVRDFGYLFFNDGPQKSLEEQVRAWWSGCRRTMYTSLVDKATTATYRLSRQMGPEIALVTLPATPSEARPAVAQLSV